MFGGSAGPSARGGSASAGGGSVTPNGVSAAAPAISFIVNRKSNLFPVLSCALMLTYEKSAKLGFEFESVKVSFEA